MLVGRGHARHEATQAQGPTFHDQIARLRETYPDGFQDSKWVEEVRGEGAKSSANWPGSGCPLVRSWEVMLPAGCYPSGMGLYFLAARYERQLPQHCSVPI